ncbi:XRE family transcriptional regulator [Moraxella haemolytica]|uniref:helix-turn-helix domain-containing protein n=1 Tax=Moraxella haemolytica TaxID=2904119 RepID=UPI002543A0FC|nr:XRE family transcriptional regulator [Moraxella sp. ZY171148]WII94677.1 XRE family transcriptional regulator [Moraxella sp. ZY171148]
MSTFSERLYKLRKEKKLARDALGAKIGVSKTAIKNWEDGENMPKVEHVQALAKFFGVSFDWLATGGQNTKLVEPIRQKLDIDIIKELKDKIAAIENRKVAHSEGLEPSNALSINNPVPVIEWVAAGSWAEANAVIAYDAFDYLPRPFNFPENGFALKVRGVSMMPKFEPGDFIYVDPNYGFWELKNGDLVVVREGDNHEATFKQLIIGETAEDMYLKPLNPDWHEQKMIPKSEWELVGKVVGKWTAF